jgi:hypothetical protein
MTEEAVTLEDLLRVREEFIADLVGQMPDEHRRFLISFEEGKPECGLHGVPHIEQLPALQWRVRNLAGIDPKKRNSLLRICARCFGVRTEKRRQEFKIV